MVSEDEVDDMRMQTSGLLHANAPLYHSNLHFIYESRFGPHFGVHNIGVDQKVVQDGTKRWCGMGPTENKAEQK